MPYALNASSASATAGVPSGVIVMWHGSADSIPEGWALCDGKDDIT
ncbi:MAG: tail fiber protein, partial [Desulfobacteraceae bacterium]|nr:tail fiber protein [Desulfobacteraceae bacterium]